MQKNKAVADHTKKRDREGKKSQHPRKVLRTRGHLLSSEIRSPADGRICCSVRGTGGEKPWQKADRKGEQNKEAEEKDTKRKGT